MNITEPGKLENDLLDSITLLTLLGKLSSIDRKLIIDFYILETPKGELERKYVLSGEKIDKRIRKIIKQMRVYATKRK